MERSPDDEAVASPEDSIGGARAELPAQPIDAWALRAASVSIEVIEMEATLKRTLRLEEPLNTVLRGLFGARLRDLRCLTRAPQCEGCGETAACDFARIFETPAALTSGAHGLHGIHPFWLRGVPAIQQVPAQTKVTARLSVVGFARPGIAYLDVSLRDAWTRLAPAMVALSGSQVRRESPAASPRSAHALRLTAVTPLMLGGDRARAAEDCPAAPWLGLLMRAGARRIQSLQHAYGRDLPAERALFPDLRQVELVQGRWSMWKSSRYSARQGQRVPLAGWVGSAVVRGAAIEALSPLLEVLAMVSVGKGTTMGFGELRVEPWLESSGSDGFLARATGGEGIGAQ